MTGVHEMTAKKTRSQLATAIGNGGESHQHVPTREPHKQVHIASAVVFELSKVSIETRRVRTLGNLRNFDEDPASPVAAGLATESPNPIQQFERQLI